MDVRPEQQDPELHSRSYWRWSKQDFFPEASFQSLASYKAALSHTCSRLRDRLLNRSTDAFELVELRKASEHNMHKCLTWWDLVWLSFGSVVGSGIFTITGLEAHDHAGPAIVLSYAISGLSALLSSFCYTEFAVEIPVAGGSFSYLRVELGDFIAFIAAGNILLEAVVGAAGLGRAWSSYFASMIKNNPDFLRIKVSSLAEELKSGPLFPNGGNGVFKAAAIVYWSYTGFDMVATMAEETKRPSRDIPLGLVGSMAMITVVYCLMALALTMMEKYTQIDRDAAYSVAFGRIGMNWAKYLVSICALKGMTTSLLVGSLGQARYTTQIARAHMIPPWFALVHPRTGTPIYATLLVTITSVIVAFFSSLDVLSSVFSFSTLFIFMLIAVALLVRRYYVRDVTPNLVKFLACLFVIIGSCIGGTVLWNLNKGGWIGYVVAGLVWFLGTLAMAVLPKHRAPKVWGVPLVPWLPSLSIGMNIFLIGSLGSAAFWRFFICSAVMLIYYFLVGLHATYDVAHQDEQELKNEEGKEDMNQGL
ncbi:hypothetical protein SLA2020_279050 [Shorea laevis]